MNSQEIFVRVDQEVDVHVVTQGHEDHPPVVLVHGYPDNLRIWDAVARQLANRFHVIRYDVRGSGLSGKPEAVCDYRLSRLSADLQAVVEAVIPGQEFHLVGHDWGSVQSWESVGTEPLKSRILSYTSISGPCLDHVALWMRHKLASASLADKQGVVRQIMNSWYIWFFHLPVLPAGLWQLGLDKAWPRILQRREKVTEVAPNPTQKTDGLYGMKLYQANFRERFRFPQERRAACPVQLIVPLQDHFVGSHLFDELHQWVPELVRRDVDAGHWLPLTHSEQLAQWIGQFAEEKNTVSLAS